MYNPAAENSNLECYSRYGARAGCPRCLYAADCRAARKSGRVEAAFTDAGEAADRLPDPAPAPGETGETGEEETGPGRIYRYWEMVRLTRFFIELTPREFMILKFRILYPAMPVAEVARQLRMTSGKAIYDFFGEICRKYPALNDLLYSHKKEAE